MLKNVMEHFGKRSKLDKVLAREFIKKEVHILVSNTISSQLDSKSSSPSQFCPGGYCWDQCDVKDGKPTSVTSVVEINCGLMDRISRRLEEAVLWKNPHLKELFTTVVSFLRRPEVINED